MTRTPRQRLRLVLLRTFARLSPPPDSPVSDLSQARPGSFAAPRILVIRPDHLGDLLFVSPALRALRQRYPDARIEALVGPWGAPVLHGNPHVDRVRHLPFPGFSRGRKPPLFESYGLVHHWAQHLRGQYDLAFILRFDHWWGALLAYLADVPQRVGYAVPEVTPFLSHAVPYAAGRHEVEQNLRLINWDGLNHHQPTRSPTLYSPTHQPLEFHVPEPTTSWVETSLATESLIAIHPGAGAPIKLWRPARWAAVADALASTTGLRILITGSKEERPLCLEIATKMKTEAQVLAGETTLAQLAGTLAACRLVLGPDSGPLHLAVAVGTPTVHLYGPVDPTFFGPWGAPKRHRVAVSAWPCIPCNRLDYSLDEVAHHPCVREIDVDAVLAAARQLLSI